MKSQLSDTLLLKTAVFVFFLALYLVTMVDSGDVAYRADEKGMFWVCQSLVEDGDVNVLNQGAKLAKDRNDASVSAYMTSRYPIIPSLVGVPFYMMGKWGSRILDRPLDDKDLFFATFLSGPIISALTCLLLFQFILAMGFNVRTAFLSTCFYGLGTLAWFYSCSQATEPITTLSILGGVYTAYLYKTKGRYFWLYLSGFLSGAAAGSREVSILIVPPLLVYLFAVGWEKAKGAPLKSKLMGGLGRLFIFLLGLLPFLVLNLWYNFARYGLSDNVGYVGYGGRVSDLFYNPLFVGLYGFLFSPGQSLFLSCPVLVLVFFSARSFYSKHKAEFILFLSIFLLHLLVYAKCNFWHGGGSFGPRYLVPTIPLLVLPMASFLETLSARSFWTKALVLLVFCVAVTISTAEFWGYPSSAFRAEAEMVENLDQENGPGLIQFFPQAFPLFWTRKSSTEVLNQFYFVPRNSKSLRLPILLALLGTTLGTGFYLIKKLNLVPGSKDLWYFAARIAAYIRTGVQTLLAYKRIAFMGAALLVVLASASYASFKYVLIPLQRFNSKPFGSIEPVWDDVTGGYVTGMTEITGWVLDRLGIRAVEIYIDDIKVADANYGEPSPDIYDVYPYMPNSDRARFTARVNTSAFSNGMHVLLIRALNQRGVWTHVTGQVVLFLNEKQYDFWARLDGAKVSGDDVVKDTVLSIKQEPRRVLLQRTGSTVTFERVPVDEWIDLRPFSNRVISLSLIAKTQAGHDHNTSSQIGWSDLKIAYPDDGEDLERR